MTTLADYITTVPAALHDSCVDRLKHEIEQERDGKTEAWAQVEILRVKLAMAEAALDRHAEDERNWVNERIKLQTDNRNLRDERDMLKAKLRNDMRTAWIPEAPNHPGLYANESGTDIRAEGKIQFPGLQPSTMNPHAAKQFATRGECQAWCDANPVPIFVPREHGFA